MLIAAGPAVALVLVWLCLRNDPPHAWVLQDIMGAGFLCLIQQTIRLPNLKAASAFLSLMFCFDIFWVFISPMFFASSVMVAVASGGGKENVPLMLLIPAMHDVFGHMHGLGYGDVALPGMLAAFLRRFDMLSGKGGFRGYFVPSLIGYFVGLCTAMVALTLMQMGQPAMLYP